MALASPTWLHGLAVPPFEAHRALRSGHMQTLVLPFFTVPPAPPGERVAIPVRHGHLIGRLDHVASPRGVAIVIHGINGTAEEAFVLRTAAKLQRKGFDTLRLNLRGSGESMGAAAGMTHSGLTDDLRAVYDHLLTRYEHVACVGFSLGGQLLLRTVGEWGDAPPAGACAAVSISAPIDLVRCSAFVARRETALYEWFLVTRLRRRYARLVAAMPPEFTRERVRAVKTIRHFDDAVIAPLHGFRDADHYYESSGASAVLPAVRVPTVIVHAADDPLVPVAPVLDARATASSWVRFVVTERGGHVGFVAQRPAAGDDDRYWAECRAADFVGASVRG